MLGWWDFIFFILSWQWRQRLVFYYYVLEKSKHCVDKKKLDPSENQDDANTLWGILAAYLEFG